MALLFPESSDRKGLQREMKPYKSVPQIMKRKEPENKIQACT
jgi:hypothetical protein